MDASLWFHQNAIKLSKQIGVDLHGCKKDARALFMKIDSFRKVKRQETKPLVTVTPKKYIRTCGHLGASGTRGNLFFFVSEEKNN